MQTSFSHIVPCQLKPQHNMSDSADRETSCPRSSILAMLCCCSMTSANGSHGNIPPTCQIITGFCRLLSAYRKVSAPASLALHIMTPNNAKHALVAGHRDFLQMRQWQMLMGNAQVKQDCPGNNDRCPNSMSHVFVKNALRIS